MDNGGNRRLLPIGAEPMPQGGVDFRVWAPRRRRVDVVIEGQPGSESIDLPRAVELAAEPSGYFSGLIPEASAGTRYRFRLDGDDDLFPDPASRFQPEGPHGPSQVVDPRVYRWNDQGWRGISLEGQVFYEMHIGTFTPEGTWEAAGRELEELASLGITVLNIMPVADFPGRFGWGYDGVNLFAPTRLYGEPDDFRRFVDKAHSLGLAVILDVVYNHLGPEGNYLKQYSDDYFTDRYTNEWGEAVNLDGGNSGAVREFFLANAGYWISEYHLDGLRLDATQTLFDESSEHLLAALSRRVREVACDRAVLLVAENEPQQVKLVRPLEEGGYGIDALWNDDFHHSATVALTGRSEAYYTDYQGSPQELIAALKWGFLYQGQYYRWQRKRRGTPTLGLKPSTFVVYLQNHDQIANSARGLRIHQLTSPGRHRALTALLLLAPQTPMLFQGQEFSASTPFLYFADLEHGLAAAVRKGRTEFLEQFPSIASDEIRALLADPGDPATFERCKLDLSERHRHLESYTLHSDLLRLRCEDPTLLRAQRHGGIDGAVLGPEAFVIRFFGDDGDDRLLLVNLGRDLSLVTVSEPLLAPPEGRGWETLWSSESPRYGGQGTPPLDIETGWRILAEAAVLMKPSAISCQPSTSG
ncbi:MAG: malto-oligosyltrehalose trehalohydrolase [Chloroflexota bacterium]